MEVSQFRIKRGFQIAIHSIAWGLMFVSPMLFAVAQNETVTWQRYLNFLIGPLSFLIVFYLNYFYLINRLLFRKHWGKFIVAELLLIVIVLLFQHGWYEMCHYYLPNPQANKQIDHARPPLYLMILWNAMMQVLIAGLSVAIRMTGNWYRVENEKQEMERQRTEAELQNLKSQLNPHFLFNTLNNIYALIQLDPPKAQYAVHGLSHLLRYVLYDNNQAFILLDKEFAFMKSYVELMNLRLQSDRVELKTSFPPDGRGYEVAPLLFITLVENAFKHGISPCEPSFVHINFRFAETDMLICTIENSDHPKADNDRSGSGIGLNNLRKRLNLLYPERHILRTERMSGHYVAQLMLQLRPVGSLDTPISTPDSHLNA